MNCMKCGREISLGQVFCKECLADMANYPVKPGTPVQLPSQSATVSPRRARSPRKPRKPDEQIIILKKWLIALSVSLFTVILAACVTITILSHKLDEANNNALPGQNYSTVDDLNTTG